LWCDSYAHKIALENSVKTISVFGTWIDIFYPSVNSNLFEEILKKPFEQGYLTVSNALQWRLQYKRVIELNNQIEGVYNYVR